MIKMGIRPHVDVDRKGVFHIYITVYNDICSATYTQNIYIYIHIYIYSGICRQYFVGQDWIPRLGVVNPFRKCVFFELLDCSNRRFR